MVQDNVSTEAILKGLREWLESLDRSAHSVRAYLSDLRQFAAWFLEHTGEPFRVEAVTAEDIREWRDHLAGKMKPATVNRKLSALSTLYRWALETRQANQDPTQYVGGVAQQETAPKALSERDMRRILRQARLGGKKRDVALLELLAATGLRVSEIATLTVDDLELNERSGWVTVSAGNGRRQRRVPVHAKARRALWEHLETLDDAEAEAPLFVTQKGAQMTPYAVWYTVKKYAQLAKVEDVTPHSFRHTVATRLVRDPDVDMVTAATFLGHSRLDTTARYSRPSEEDLTEAAEKLR